MGNIFYGREGFLELGSGTWKAYRENETEPFAQSKDDLPENDYPFLKSPRRSLLLSANFIDAVRNEDDSRLYCDIIDGHNSCVLPHLANISCRLGREVEFMGEYEKFANDPEANLMLTRNYRKPYVISKDV